MLTIYKTMSPEKVTHLIVHCAATPPSMDVGRTEIDRWHRERGFFQIGYHYVIRRDGRIEKGRPDDMPGAHTLKYNGRSLGICMVGGVKESDKRTAEDNFTDEQYATLYMLLCDLKEKYPHADIVGHRDVQKGKDCPSFDVSEYLEQNPLT